MTASNYCPREIQKRRPRTHIGEFRLPPGVAEREYLTLGRASSTTGIPYETIRYWIRMRDDNGLMVYRHGKRLFLRAGEFARWLETNIVPW